MKQAVKRQESKALTGLFEGEHLCYVHVKVSVSFRMSVRQSLSNQGGHLSILIEGLNLAREEAVLQVYRVIHCQLHLLTREQVESVLDSGQHVKHAKLVLNSEEMINHDRLLDPIVVRDYRVEVGAERVHQMPLVFSNTQQ